MTSFGALQELRRGSHAANPDLAEHIASTSEEYQITNLIEGLILSARLRWLDPKEQQRLAFLYNTYDWALEIYNNIYTINSNIYIEGGCPSVHRHEQKPWNDGHTWTKDGHEVDTL